MTPISHRGNCSAQVRLDMLRHNNGHHIAHYFHPWKTCPCTLLQIVFTVTLLLTPSQIQGTSSIQGTSTRRMQVDTRGVGHQYGESPPRTVPTLSPLDISATAPSFYPSSFPTSFPSSVPTPRPTSVPTTTENLSPSFIQYQNESPPSRSSVRPSPHPSVRPSPIPSQVPNIVGSDGSGSNSDGVANGGNQGADLVNGSDGAGGEVINGSDGAGDENGDGSSLIGSAVFCPGFTAGSSVKKTVWWQYSMQLKNETSSGVPAQLQVLEPQLMSEIQSTLLSCDDPVRRSLAADFGIVGLDYMPVDSLTADKCPSPSQGCFVIDGWMYVYLEGEEYQSLAEDETRKAIYAVMSESDSPLTNGQIEKVEYLKPILFDTSKVQDGSETDNSMNSANGSSAGLAVLGAMGGFLVVMTTVAVCRYRKNIDSAEKDGPSTIASATQLTGAESNLSNNSGARSAFSNMLPTAYRTNEPDNMSAILEDSDSASQARSSDIMISESGYTTEDSRDHSYMHSINYEDNILGAQKMDDYGEDDGFLFDNDDLNSPSSYDESTKERDPETSDF